MKIVFLDCAGVNPGDISWGPIEELGEFEFYKSTDDSQLMERISGADAVIIDSYPIDRMIMEMCPELKFIGIAATGYNHVDLEAARKFGIAVANVPAYSTDAVAQHAIALLLYITNNIENFNSIVQEGKWLENSKDQLSGPQVTLLAGKSIGIIGYGNIGKKVAHIAEALGMRVNIYSKDKAAAMKSDVVSLHCPLTPENKGMIDETFISQMKDGAILINTARGGLLDERAVSEALRSGKIAAAGLDVLAEEPALEDNPLMRLENCWITPHIAFIPYETRKIVVDTCADNLKSFIDGGSLNRLV